MEVQVLESAYFFDTDLLKAKVIGWDISLMRLQIRLIRRVDETSHRHQELVPP